MVTGISLTGMASGMDTDEIVRELMELERVPIQRMEFEKETITAKQEQWQAVNQQLQGLKSSFDDLASRAVYNDMSASSSDENLVSVTASSSADTGNYSLEVDQLAQSHSVYGEKFEPGEPLNAQGLNITGNEQFSIGFEGNDEVFTIDLSNIDKAADEITLRDIRSLINQKDGLEATATLVDERLVIRSDNTGADYQLDFTDGLPGTEATATDDIAGTEVTIIGGENEAYNDLSINFAQGTEAGVTAEIVDNEITVTLGPDGTVDTQAINDALATLGAEDGPEGTDVSAITVDFLGEINVDDLAGTVFNLEGGESPVDGGGLLESIGILDGAGDIAGIMEEGQDAIFAVNGLTGITSSTNEGIDNVIEGVTLELGGLTDGPVNISIGQDTDSISQTVNQFVDQYNAVQGFMSELGKEEGLLQGDSTLRRLQSSLRRRVTSDIGFGDGFNNIQSLGIEIDDEGVMDFNAEEMEAALRDNPEDVESFFRAREEDAGTDGLARRMSGFIEEYVRFGGGRGGGILNQQNQNFDSQLDRIDRRIEVRQDRLERRERTMQRQFARMETALNQIQAQGSWMEGQLQSLGNLNDR